MDERKELWEGASTFGSFPGLFTSLLCVSCPLLQGQGAVLSCCYLRNSSSNRDAAVTAASPFPFSYTPSPSFLSSLPQHFASILPCLSLPFFHPLGIHRMTRECASLLKFQCQINIKAGRKIHLTLCDLLWSATQGPAQHCSEGLNRFHSHPLHRVWRIKWPSALKKPVMGRELVPTKGTGLNDMERTRRGRTIKTKTLSCLFFFFPLLLFFSSRWIVTRIVQKMLRSPGSDQRVC